MCAFTDLGLTIFVLQNLLESIFADLKRFESICFSLNSRGTCSQVKINTLPMFQYRYILCTHRTRRYSPMYFLVQQMDTKTESPNTKTGNTNLMSVLLVKQNCNMEKNVGVR